MIVTAAWWFFYYLIACLIIWVALLDEYDATVLGFQQTNFRFGDRARLVLLFPGLPLLFLVALACCYLVKPRQGIVELSRRFFIACRDHVWIIAKGEHYGFKRRDEWD